MSYPTKIAYPSPPPTTNSLTSQQRNHLLRSTKKLSKILGTTPALIEKHEDMPSMIPLNLQRLAVPLHAALSSKYTDDEALVHYPSSDTLVSASSDYDTPSYLKRSSSRSSDRSSRSVSPIGKAPSPYLNTYESWPKSQAERPFLRISVPPSKNLEAIPQSPPGTGSGGYSPPPAYSVHPPPEHTSYTLCPMPASRTLSSPSAASPAFTIPSENSVRRQKMDKLRRTLGDGIPLDLVFPGDESRRSSSSSEDNGAYAHSRPQPPPQRIRAARDSLLLPHATRPAPAAPVLTPRAAKKLSMIAERGEEVFPPLPSPQSSVRGSTESERYEGDTEADFVRSHRRSSRVYSGEQRVKRVPVPAA